VIIAHEPRLSETAVPNTKTTLLSGSWTYPCSAGQGVDQLIIAHAQADINHEARLTSDQYFHHQHSAPIDIIQGDSWHSANRAR
jgi:hypothetical protein